jgi:hypothetical protein
MVHKTSSPHLAPSEPESPTLTEDLVRQRAYELYEERGCEDGHELDDWFKAEGEILGKKPSVPVTEQKATAKSAVAG